VGADATLMRNTVDGLRKLAIDGVVAIGGDDMVRRALAIERESKGRIKVVMVPKSIDNDLAVPDQVTTLGHETARHVGVQIVKHLMEDARTTGRWYLGVTMGRPTGHLTLGIGKAAGATCTIIPEELGPGPVRLADIADIVEGSIIKRRAAGRSYGVVLLSEALVERFDPAEVEELQDVDRDAQGNIRVTEIDLGRKVKNGVQMRLEQRGIKVTIVDKTIGYELRCAPPIPMDAEYARDLGYAALENVVKNALDALAGRGGKITIYARYIGGKWVSLRVRDTGPGVAVEIRDKIFEPGVSTKSGGWGVGLALSRRIVEGVHSGRIELLDTQEGTTIQIRLPAADA
jgi:6-phosphofructokinase 1